MNRSTDFPSGSPLSDEPAASACPTENDYFRQRFSTQAKAFAVSKLASQHPVSNHNSGAIPAEPVKPVPENTAMNTDDNPATTAEGTTVKPNSTAQKQIKTVVLKSQSIMRAKTVRKVKTVKATKKTPVQDRGVKEEKEWAASLIDTDSSLPRIDPVSTVLGSLEKENQPVPDRLLAAKTNSQRNARKQEQAALSASPTVGLDADPRTKTIEKKEKLAKSSPYPDPYGRFDGGEYQAGSIGTEKTAGTSAKVQKTVSAPGPKRKKPVSDTAIPASQTVAESKGDLTDEEIRNGLLAGKAKRDEFFDFLNAQSESAEKPSGKERMGRFFRKLLVTVAVLAVISAGGFGVWWGQKHYHWFDRFSSQTAKPLFTKVFTVQNMASLQRAKNSERYPYLLISPQRGSLTLITYSADDTVTALSLKESDLSEETSGRQSLTECDQSGRGYMWYQNLLTCKNLISENLDPQVLAEQGATDPMQDAELKKTITEKIVPGQQVTISTDGTQYWVVEQINDNEVKIIAYPVKSTK